MNEDQSASRVQWQDENEDEGTTADVAQGEKSTQEARAKVRHEIEAEEHPRGGEVDKSKGKAQEYAR